MPPKHRASKNSQTRKSTCKVQKTARSQQTEVESEEDLPLAEAAPPTLPDDDNDFYVNDDEEARIIRREEEEESKEEEEEKDDEKDEDNDSVKDENKDNEEEEPEIILVVPQKRKKGKDPKNSSSKIFFTLSPHLTFSKSFSECVNRHELKEVEEICKITYNLAIFSVAKLAKPQAHREPTAHFLVLSYDLEWLDLHAWLKIKACNVLFPRQVAIDNSTYEITFCIPRHVPNPLPLTL